MKYIKSSMFHTLLTIMLLLIFIFTPILNTKGVLIVFLAVSLLIMCIRYFYTGCIVNIIILIYLPFMIVQNQYLFLNKDHTSSLIFILCVIFFMTILNFLILAYQINSYDNNHGNVPTTFRRPFFKILCIFFLYLSLLFSVIDSFALLYVHLSNVFNEGIVGKGEVFSHLDALYFSTTTFFTIGFGDIRPIEYSEVTKKLVIIQAALSHIITTVLWPVAIIFVFGKTSRKLFGIHKKD
ncbi:hypothetical protein HZI73_19355 [Vallitalea pronyensis]|uniref:Potassium channel domain-containing protein n=1 Tax=Vallitalea pronyensis TaxID=1348613 RepID=A0A8J8MM72_9FIRM|nr:ion channel [Vallitalea pronyensis]QUI24320.1 hypothetical protein HZI73_19355 [Vallitalea pronyensis]